MPVFLKIAAHVFLKPINITLGLGEVFEECLWGVLVLVELQAYSLLLDCEMISLGAFSKILPGFWEHSFFPEKLLSGC